MTFLFQPHRLTYNYESLAFHFSCGVHLIHFKTIKVTVTGARKTIKHAFRTVLRFVETRGPGLNFSCPFHKSAGIHSRSCTIGIIFFSFLFCIFYAIYTGVGYSHSDILNKKISQYYAPRHQFYSQTFFFTVDNKMFVNRLNCCLGAHYQYQLIFLFKIS